MTRCGVLLFIFTGFGVLSGCTGTTDSASTGSGGKGQTSGDSSAAERPEPLPVEEIPFATDNTYESIAIEDGTTAGEVREFTALKIKFCWCPAATFTMGSGLDAPGHLNNEIQHDVTLSRGFWIQQTELTQAQYEKLMGTNPAFFPGPDNPVETLSWPEATEFCRRLSELPPEKNLGNQFRLPTEAEWEYACRAGSDTSFCFGDDEEMLGEYAWYHSNSERTTHPVGQKKANAWNVHDMHGNVMEWCQDFFGDYPSKAVTDPQGPKSGDKRCLRGGGWSFVPMYARSYFRDAYVPSANYVGLGFRLVATSPDSTEESTSPGEN